MGRVDDSQSINTFLPFFNEDQAMLRLQAHKKSIVQLIVFITFALLLVLTALVVFFTVPGVFTIPSIVVGLLGLIIFSSTLALCIQSYVEFRKSSGQIGLYSVLSDYRASFDLLNEQLKQGYLFILDFRNRFNLSEGGLIDKSRNVLIELSASYRDLEASIASLTPDLPICSDFVFGIGKNLEKMHQKTKVFLVDLEESIDRQSEVLIAIRNLQTGLHDFTIYFESECLSSGVLKENVLVSFNSILDLKAQLYEVETKLIFDSDTSSESNRTYCDLVNNLGKSLRTVIHNFNQGLLGLQDLLDNGLFMVRINDINEFLKRCDCSYQPLLKSIDSCRFSNGALLKLRNHHLGLQEFSGRIGDELDEVLAQLKKIPDKALLLESSIAQYSNLIRHMRDWQSAAQQANEIRVDRALRLIEQEFHEQYFDSLGCLSAKTSHKETFSDALDSLLYNCQLKVDSQKERFESMSLDCAGFFSASSYLFWKGALSLELSEIEEAALRAECDVFGTYVHKKYCSPTISQGIDYLSECLHDSLLKERMIFDSSCSMLRMAESFRNHFHFFIAEHADLSDQDLSILLDQQIIQLRETFQESSRSLLIELAEFSHTHEKERELREKLISYIGDTKQLGDHVIEVLPILRELVETRKLIKDSSAQEFQREFHVIWQKYRSVRDSSLSFLDDILAKITLEDLNNWKACIHSGQDLAELIGCSVEMKRMLVMLEDVDLCLVKSIESRLNGFEQQLQSFDYLIRAEHYGFVWLGRAMSCLEMMGCSKDKYLHLQQQIAKQLDRLEEIKFLRTTI